jgi:hypothetical protein
MEKSKNPVNLCAIKYRQNPTKSIVNNVEDEMYNIKEEKEMERNGHRKSE